MGISNDLISRYPLFADLTTSQVTALSKAAEGLTATSGEYIFREGEDICCFYVVVEGAVGIVIEAVNIKDQEKSDDVIFSAVGPGGAFGWSALVPPHTATASAKALSACWLLSFDCRQLIKDFEDDPEFGYRMLTKVAQISRDRLRDTRIESLVFTIK